jgi:predicted RNase H-like HicB family nuclease
MNTSRYVYWQDDMWLGYLEDYPDYRSQGQTLEELQENLRDIVQHVTSVAIPNVKHIGELQVT